MKEEYLPLPQTKKEEYNLKTYLPNSVAQKW
jgi:hypothetical protein